MQNSVGMVADRNMPPSAMASNHRIADHAAIDDLERLLQTEALRPPTHMIEERIVFPPQMPFEITEGVAAKIAPLETAPLGFGIDLRRSAELGDERREMRIERRIVQFGLHEIA